MAGSHGEAAQTVFQWFISRETRRHWEFTVSYLTDEQFPMQGCQVKSTYRGRQFCGFGGGLDRSSALLKAICESVERHAMTRISRPERTSSGNAIHTEAPEAKRRARLELVERHLFLAHFWARRPFYRPSFLPTRVPEFQLATDFLASRGHRMLILEMQKLRGVCAYLAVILDRPERRKFGLWIGAGAAREPSSAIRSAIGEAFLGWTWYRWANRIRPISLATFDRCRTPGPTEHSRLAMGSDYLNQIGSLFADGLPAARNRVRDFNLAQIPATRVELAAERSEFFPFTIYSADDPHLISMQFGRLAEARKALVLKQLNRFWQPRPRLVSFSDFPHPFP